MLLLKTISKRIQIKLLLFLTPPVPLALSLFAILFCFFDLFSNKINLTADKSYSFEEFLFSAVRFLVQTITSKYIKNSCPQFKASNHTIPLLPTDTVFFDKISQIWSPKGCSIEYDLDDKYGQVKFVKKREYLFSIDLIIKMNIYQIDLSQNN
jgi:hypothetical protein